MFNLDFMLIETIVQSTWTISLTDVPNFLTLREPFHRMELYGSAVCLSGLRFGVLPILPLF